MRRAFIPLLVIPILAGGLFMPGSPVRVLAVSRTVQKAAKSTGRTLTGPSESVTTTTGQKLNLTVRASWIGILKSATVTVGLLKAGPTATYPIEEHNFSFVVPESDFSNSSGSAKLDVTSKQIGWYGQISLSFTPQSHQAESCSSGSGVNYVGALDGSVHFNTNQKSNVGWGSVNKQTVSWPNTKFNVSFDCSPKLTAKPLGCETGFLWLSPSVGTPNTTDSRGFSGLSLQTAGSKSVTNVITVLRTVNSVIDGTQVSRGDSAEDLSPMPKRTGTSSVAITTGHPGGQLFSGTASLTLHGVPSKQPAEPEGTCSQGSKTKNQCAKTYVPGKSGSATWANGTAPLTAHLNVGGAITLPNKTGSGFVAGSITVLSVGCT